MAGMISGVSEHPDEFLGIGKSDNQNGAAMRYNTKMKNLFSSLLFAISISCSAEGYDLAREVPRSSLGEIMVLLDERGSTRVFELSKVFQKEMAERRRDGNPCLTPPFFGTADISVCERMLWRREGAYVETPSHISEYGPSYVPGSGVWLVQDASLIGNENARTSMSISLRHLGEMHDSFVLAHELAHALLDVMRKSKVLSSRWEIHDSIASDVVFSEVFCDLVASKALSKSLGLPESEVLERVSAMRRETANSYLDGDEKESAMSWAELLSLAVRKSESERYSKDASAMSSEAVRFLLGTGVFDDFLVAGRSR